MTDAAHRWLIALLLPLLTTCAHQPPRPPPGRARLILECCEMERYNFGASARYRCRRMRPTAGVTIDGVAAGTCADWR